MEHPVRWRSTAAAPAPPRGVGSGGGRPIHQQVAGKRSTWRPPAPERTAERPPQTSTVHPHARPEPPRVAARPEPPAAPEPRHRRGATRRYARNVPVPEPVQAPSRPSVERPAGSPEGGGNAETLNSRAYRLQREGRHAEAEPLLREALRKHPNYAYAQDNLGWSLLEQGKARAAVGPLERTASAQPRRWEPQERLAQAYERLGMKDRAAAARARAAALRHGSGRRASHRRVASADHPGLRHRSRRRHGDAAPTDEPAPEQPREQPDRSDEDRGDRDPDQ